MPKAELVAAKSFDAIPESDGRKLDFDSFRAESQVDLCEMLRKGATISKSLCSDVDDQRMYCSPSDGASQARRMTMRYRPAPACAQRPLR